MMTSMRKTRSQGPVDQNIQMLSEMKKKNSRASTNKSSSHRNRNPIESPILADENLPPGLQSPKSLMDCRNNSESSSSGSLSKPFLDQSNFSELLLNPRNTAESFTSSGNTS